MMSNVNAGIPESASQGHSSHRNPPFRSQAQLPPTLSHHEHHATDTFIPRHHSQHSGQFQQTHFNTPSGHHQHRPPVAPTHQPRLHHSISAGNIALVANTGQFGGIGGTAHGGAAAPKKKDPYATAWRTYSKIAEELQLLNPDGSLYPISKEAILKYLHHQSKRIKSSNLHWYVNGLKKHQENLGFPWDDVRYDDQVVGLLKELTLHPVIVENGDEDHHHGHSYVSQPNRQRQTSSSSNSNGNLVWKGGHHYSSSSSSAIDPARIANLSISQSPQSAHHQNHYVHSGSYGGGLKQQHHSQYLQQAHQSQRIQQPPPPKPYYHSAPIQLTSHHSRTPSGQELPNLYQGSQPHHQQYHHPQSTPGGSSSALPPSGEPHPREGAPSGSILNAKRKRSEIGLQKRRVPSSMSLEGDEHEEDDTRDDDKDDDDESEDRRHEVDEFDDLDEEEDQNRYQPLKRRASTGTLLNQVKASAVKHVPGNLILGRDGPNSQRYDHRYRSPSPDGGRNDRYSSLSRQDAHARDSPPNSASSTEDPSALFLLRPTSALGIGGTNTSSSTAIGSVGSASTATPAAKMTVQFSEVVECAQQLQLKYGNQCKDHPWGCVEIHDCHLELTIKMYLDWAGLVASGRLTMEDLPDLPEFRKPELQFGFVLGSSTHATSGSGPSACGTLKRMSSTPFSTQHRMSFNTYRSPSTSPAQDPTEEDDPQSPPPRRATGFSILGSPKALDLGSDVDTSTPVTSPASKPTTLTFASLPHARGARKMPSSPALSLHHALQGHDLRHHTHSHSSDHHLMRSRAHGSIVSTSTASPPSELESDDEEEEDDVERERHKRGGAAMDVDMEGEEQHQTRPSTWMGSNGSPSRASGLSTTTTTTTTGGMMKELTPTERMEDDEDESRNGTDKRINVATQEEDSSTSATIQMSAEGQVGMIGEIADAKTLNSIHSSGPCGSSGSSSSSHSSSSSSSSYEAESTSPPMSNESVGARKESKLRMMMGRGKALFASASLKAVSPSTSTTTSSTTTSTITTSSRHKSVGGVATEVDSGTHGNEAPLGGSGVDTEDCEMVE